MFGTAWNMALAIVAALFSAVQQLSGLGPGDTATIRVPNVGFHDFGNRYDVVAIAVKRAEQGSPAATAAQQQATGERLQPAQDTSQVADRTAQVLSGTPNTQAVQPAMAPPPPAPVPQPQQPPDPFANMTI